ncbi:hypothetical protein [Escherichia phage UPEC01]|nr:hypothetical protein [Escherichia phage UPEC01]
MAFDCFELTKDLRTIIHGKNKSVKGEKVVYMKDE